MHGPGPGSRYGHVMALVGKIFFLEIGGNDGKIYMLALFSAIGACILLNIFVQHDGSLNFYIICFKINVDPHRASKI